MPVERIIVVGGGVTGWCAASALARSTRCRIVVVDAGGNEGSLGVPTPVLSALPSAVTFHAQLGHDENAMLAATGGTFSLGMAISNLLPENPASFVPFGDIGAPFGPVGFHHLVTRLRQEGQTVNLANFSVAALCAQAGRFGRPAPHDRSVLSTMEYGFHLHSDAYAAWLRADALAQGVQTISGDLADAQHDEAGLLNEIRLTNGDMVAGDLFIDCTGPGAMLLNKMDGVAFESWADGLPLNRSVAQLLADNAAPPPYVHVDAHRSGLLRFGPVQGGMGEQMLFSAEYEPERAASALPFTPGCRRQPWVGNCLALGGSAMTIDPAMSIPLHMLHSSILRLLGLLPHDRSCRIEAREFNRQFDEECDGARDLALLPYALNGREGEPFWDNCRGKDLSDRLRHRIEVYRHTARVALYDGDLLETSQWVAWFDALGIRPLRYDVVADGIPLAEIEAHLERIRSIMLKALAGLPPHAEYLLRHCPAGQRRAA